MKLKVYKNQFIKIILFIYGNTKEVTKGHTSTIVVVGIKNEKSLFSLLNSSLLAVKCKVPAWGLASGKKINILLCEERESVGVYYYSSIHCSVLTKQAMYV
jgi:hypothetical protein